MSDGLELLTIKINEHGTGEEVRGIGLRVKLFVLGKAKMQMRARGIIEMTKGEEKVVRTFSFRHDHNPNMNGDLKTVGEPLRVPFEEAVDGLRRVESQWITEELDVWEPGQPVPDALRELMA